MVKVDERGRNKVERIYTLRKRIKQLQEMEKSLVVEAKKHIKLYETLKLEDWSAMITVSERRSPKWKEEFIAVAGEEKANEITANTKPSLIESLDIFYQGVKAVI